MNRPPVVSAEEWQAERDKLLVKEKELTHALDDLAAQRRRLPMVRLKDGYVFTGPDGETGDLVSLFDGHNQLIIYHYMKQPGSDHLCVGCASLTDNLSPWAHLAPRGVRLILESVAPQEELEPLRQRFGWQIPWYSSYGSTFNEDMGTGGGFGVSVLLRDGDDVFRTWFTNGRGTDRLRLDFNLLDLTPYGRQEVWEDSPEGWPQTSTMGWLRLRDEYPQH
ncbi:DUF899 domain-containing protein [Amycolatopsis sp. cg9]|uniref:DUF899 domain-containing protein n=1 Tax=Amycolatopsis sp. cg9 TaxID=3238801 RepID=UPI00352451E5